MTNPPDAGNDREASMTLFDSTTDEPWGIWDGKCQACDQYGPVDDLSLCEECGSKFERDMIRRRAWDYSASAFGLPPDAREALRCQVIAEYGEGLELITGAMSADPGSSGGQEKRRPKRR